MKIDSKKMEKALTYLNKVNPAAYAQLLLLPFGPVPGYAWEDPNHEWWNSEDAVAMYQSIKDAFKDGPKPGGPTRTIPGAKYSYQTHVEGKSTVKKTKLKEFVKAVIREMYSGSGHIDDKTKDGLTLISVLTDDMLKDIDKHGEKSQYHKMLMQRMGTRTSPDWIINTVRKVMAEKGIKTNSLESVEYDNSKKVGDEVPINRKGGKLKITAISGQRNGGNLYRAKHRDGSDTVFQITKSVQVNETHGGIHPDTPRPVECPKCKNKMITLKNLEPILWGCEKCGNIWPGECPECGGKGFTPSMDGNIKCGTCGTINEDHGDVHYWGAQPKEKQYKISTGYNETPKMKK